MGAGELEPRWKEGSSSQTSQNWGHQKKMGFCPHSLPRATYPVLPQRSTLTTTTITKVSRRDWWRSEGQGSHWVSTEGPEPHVLKYRGSIAKRPRELWGTGHQPPDNGEKIELPHESYTQCSLSLGPGKCAIIWGNGSPRQGCELLEGRNLHLFYGSLTPVSRKVSGIRLRPYVRVECASIELHHSRPSHQHL